jgi:hypothetical protein
MAGIGTGIGDYYGGQRTKENMLAAAEHDGALTTSDENRRLFVNYVNDVTQFQRNEVTDRIEKVNKHQLKWKEYFLGCNFICCGMTVAGMMWWGPRHITSESSYWMRPMLPAVGMGCTLYSIVYNVRLYMMKVRLWAVIEDMEYEIKKTSSHHVAEGALHLAWLQFVVTQLKADKQGALDPAALRLPPKMYKTPSPTRPSNAGPYSARKKAEWAEEAKREI